MKISINHCKYVSLSFGNAVSFATVSQLILRPNIAPCFFSLSFVYHSARDFWNTSARTMPEPEEITVSRSFPRFQAT